MSEAAGGLLIGEFARRCRLPVSTLRYYADVGLLLPAAVDPATGYRRYRADQVEAATMIARLRALGLSPAAMAEILAGGGKAAAALERERCRLERELAVRQRALAELDRLPLTGPAVGDGEVRRVPLAPDPVLLWPVRSAAPSLGGAVIRSIARLRRHLRTSGVPACAPFGGLFALDLAAEVEATVFVRLPPGAAVPPGAGLGRLPQGVAAEAVHDGPYDRLPVTCNALFQWIDLAGATPVGPVVEEYLSLGSRPAESGPRTRILVPLAPG